MGWKNKPKIFLHFAHVLRKLITMFFYISDPFFFCIRQFKMENTMHV